MDASGSGSGSGTGAGSGSCEVPGVGSEEGFGSEGLAFLAGGEPRMSRLSCSKSDPKLTFFLSLLDLLGGSPPGSPPFPPLVFLFPIIITNKILKRSSLVSSCLVSDFQNGCSMFI